MIQITINRSPQFVTEDEEILGWVDFDYIKCELERGIHYEYPEEHIEFEIIGEPSKFGYFYLISCIYAESEEMKQYVNDCIESIDFSDERYYLSDDRSYHF